MLRYDATTGPSSVFVEGGGASGIRGLRFGPDGDLYLASATGDAILRYDGTSGAPLGVFAAAGGLDAPGDLHFGADGNLYVDSSNVGILRYDGASGAFLDTFLNPAGDYEASQLDTHPLQDALPGATPRIDGTGDGVSPLIDPSDAAIGPDGSIWVVGRVSQNVFRVEPDGTVTEILDAGGGGSGVPLASPFRIAAGTDGSVAVASTNEAVHRIRPDGSVIAVLHASSPNWTGAWDVVVGSDGSVYAAEPGGNRVRKVSPSGVVTTIIDSQGDGQGNPLLDPRALWLDRNDFLYVAGRGSGNVFEVTPSGGRREIFDGASVFPPLYGPQDVVKDRAGNVYVGGDAGQGWSRIFRVDVNGGASLWVTSSVPLQAMTIDDDGDLYYSLTRGLYNHVTPTGVITPLDQLTGPLGRVLGGALDFEAAPGGDLVVPSLLANAVYHLDVPTECSDGIDNDGDGDVDFPADDGCRAEDWVEDPACDDGVDNDGDGTIDFAGGPSGQPADPVCRHAWEATEQSGCGLGFELVAALLPLHALRRRRRRAPDGPSR